MIREYIIKISDEIMEEEIADRPQELVRCKDCKYGWLVTEEIWCQKYIPSNVVPLDFYCAGGVKRE